MVVIGYHLLLTRTDPFIYGGRKAAGRSLLDNGEKGREGFLEGERMDFVESFSPESSAMVLEVTQQSVCFFFSYVIIAVLCFFIRSVMMTEILTDKQL